MMFFSYAISNEGNTSQIVGLRFNVFQSTHSACLSVFRKNRWEDILECRRGFESMKKNLVGFFISFLK